ncbi:DUF6233 domain-containing protein [Streptomyces rubradiris]|uniref:DUF6233 domain-containing protein n=1 Tax=Streptomyces rubradiris TaxID=285531 RepID=UPI0036E5B7E7
MGLRGGWLAGARAGVGEDAVVVRVVVQVEGLAHPVVDVAEFAAAPSPQGAFRFPGEVEQAGEVQSAVDVGGAVGDAGQVLGGPAAAQQSDCWAAAKSGRCRPATRQQARDALLQHILACVHCRPDTALSILE